MRTDVHTHVFHPGIAGKALARLAAMGFAPVGQGVVADLARRAAAAGIERVVCHTAAMTGAQVVPANNFILSLLQRKQEAPTEPVIAPFGTIHPEYADWSKELDRLEAAGIKGIKLHPNFQNLAFDDPRIFPVMEAVAGRFIVMCHVGYEKTLTCNPASPDKLAKLVDCFPNVTFIAAHLGGHMDGDINGDSAIDALLGKNVWLDTSNTARMSNAIIRKVIEKHPFERLLFGTDYPLFDPAAEVVSQALRFGWTDAQATALQNNADALLGGSS